MRRECIAGSCPTFLDVDAAATTPSLAFAAQRTDDKPRNEMYILNLCSLAASDFSNAASVIQTPFTNMTVGKRRCPYQGHERLSAKWVSVAHNYLIWASAVVVVRR
jgi:hypothetical protein